MMSPSFSAELGVKLGASGGLNLLRRNNCLSTVFCDAHARSGDSSSSTTARSTYHRWTVILGLFGGMSSVKVFQICYTREFNNWNIICETRSSEGEGEDARWQVVQRRHTPRPSSGSGTQLAGAGFGRYARGYSTGRLQARNGSCALHIASMSKKRFV